MQSIEVHLNLLVADAKRNDREATRKLITSFGHEVTTAINGQEALYHIGKEPFDAVFLEMDLPGVDGLELIKKLKSDPLFKTLPIIALTATDNPAMVKLSFQAGVDHFILKPLTADKLQAALSLYIQQKQKRANQPF